MHGVLDYSRNQRTVEKDQLSFSRSIKRKKLWISSDADQKYGSDNRRLGACSLIKHVISISNRGKILTGSEWVQNEKLDVGVKIWDERNAFRARRNTYISKRW